MQPQPDTPEDRDIPSPENPFAIQDAIRSLYDRWLAPYRGLTPHGIRKPAPTSQVYDNEPPTFDDADETITFPDQEIVSVQNMLAIPVVVKDDISGINRSLDIYHIPYQELITTQPKLIVSQDVTRSFLRLSNSGPGIVYIGATESAGTSGYPMVVNEAFNAAGTRDYWAVQQSGQANPAVLGIYIEQQRERE